MTLKGRDVTPEEYLNATLAVMKNELDQARRQIARGEKPSLVRSTNMKTGHKRFFNFFDNVVADGLSTGSKVLVVDDNIDSGWTPYHVAKRVRAAGLEPLFAAGFKMMRYYEKKEKLAPKPVATPGLDQAIADAEEASRIARDLFQVGNFVMAMDDSEELDVQAAEVYKVKKATPAGIELEDIDTLSIVRLSAKDLDPEAVGRMWALAA